jgi:hypothetical protein
MGMVLAGLRYLAAADPAVLAAQAQAGCLQAFERAAAIATGARAWFLGAFTAGQGYTRDADDSAAAWLIHRTRVTKGAARGQLGWARRTGTHPQVLLAAARAGARTEDLAGLAAEICARSLPQGEDDPEPRFEDRQLRVETTFAGAGVIAGDLTPECAAIVTAVLESLSAPQGAQDTRTREQRCHDALEEAMRRLAASGLLPGRAGQPVKVWAHLSLAELRALDDGSVLETGWVTELRIRWAAHRAEEAGGSPGDGGAWLTGDGAAATACDATVTPLVTGDADLSVLDDLARLCVELAGHGSRCAPPPAGAAGSPAGPAPAGQPAHHHRHQPRPDQSPGRPRPTRPRGVSTPGLKVKCSRVSRAIGRRAGPGRRAVLREHACAKRPLRARSGG